MVRTLGTAAGLLLCVFFHAGVKVTSRLQKVGNWDGTYRVYKVMYGRR
jgi:hypothetical protein